MRGGKPRIPEGAPGHPFTNSHNASWAKAPPPAKAPKRAGGRSRREDDERDRDDRRSARPESRRSAPPPRRQVAKLVYEDEELLAYDKPSGLAVIAPDGSRSRCLLDIATEQVRRHNPKGRAAVVHRIDRDTSGIVVFAKSALVKKELMQDWDELVSERLYVALVEGEMAKESGVCDSWLKEDAKGRVFVAKTEERGAKRAITRWRLLGSSEGLSLLELSLETGRKHQIRVQLAAAGHPVVGDERYGSRRDDMGRLCLHATSIELKRKGHKALRIESAAPKEFERAIVKSQRREGSSGSGR
jgi:Pseudouridylate synthases, 23S RNA-specific